MKNINWEDIHNKFENAIEEKRVMNNRIKSTLKMRGRYVIETIYGETIDGELVFNKDGLLGFECGSDVGYKQTYGGSIKAISCK